MFESHPPHQIPLSDGREGVSSGKTLKVGHGKACMADPLSCRRVARKSFAYVRSRVRNISGPRTMHYLLDVITVLETTHF